MAVGNRQALHFAILESLFHARAKINLLTRHLNYDELDDEDHIRLSKILSSEKSTTVNQSGLESLPDHTIAMSH